jgi:hypothetical protein
MAPLQDPRLRQTWNSISHNAEAVTENAATGIWRFTHEYIDPCFVGISHALEQCTTTCFPSRDERARRLRERVRTRGRAEYSFDFYDDWEDEPETGGGLGRSGGLLGWGNDELDRLLAGSGSSSHGGKRGSATINEQPKSRRRGMSYGTRKGGPRRKNTIDGLPDPTIIPSTNSFGFLHKLPFKIGGTLRYKPSAADLQEHPGAHRAEIADEAESEPLIDDDAEELETQDGEDYGKGRRRARSSTTGSGATSDSFRSRGDLFASDGEDDAVPLGDEFAMALERRTTSSSNVNDSGSGKTRSSKGKRLSTSARISRTISGTTQSSGKSRFSIGASLGARTGSGASVNQMGDAAVMDSMETSLDDLRFEEERLRAAEDAEIERKRHAAARLAIERGLSSSSVTGSERTTETEPVMRPSSEADFSPVEEDMQTVSPPPELEESTSDVLARASNLTVEAHRDTEAESESTNRTEEDPHKEFVPARLPNF